VSSYPRWERPRRPLAGAAFTVITTLAAVALAGAVEAAPRDSESTRVYLVQLAGDPLASYVGGVAGLAATRPAPGQRLDVHSPRARRYAEYLAGQRHAALAKVPGAEKLYDYQTVYHGFAANLTDGQAAALRSAAGVVAVVPNEMHSMETVQTPRFLGLAGADGAWQRRFGDPRRAGEGMIIGMVDSGFWPEAPSFASLPQPRPDQALIDAKWRGTCDPGIEEPVTCNNKVIGARYYNNGGVPAAPEEFVSPRDWHGHGSHTAGTAAGNHDVPVVVGGVNLGNASGMAPAARLAIYKVCWATDTAGGNACATVDQVAAIDQAVADGVDVLNLSISGSRTSLLNPVAVAFRHAAAAGVFAANSAGNAGDTIGVSSVAHNSPWVTTVAASTHDRGFVKTVTLGDGRTFAGVGMSPAVPTAPLLNSTLAGLAGANPTEVQLCFPGMLDPALVAGKIIACDRGINARVEKSRAVQLAGGVGMILMNVTPGSLNADFHFVPTVHVDHIIGAQIRAYSLTAGATAALSATDPSPVRAPQMASFSSFGPALAGGGDLLKPDITAPGVDVLAAAAPPGVVGLGNVWGQISGTSMSSPHIAGIGALLMQYHPTWSPMAVKSALMTTAKQIDNTGASIQRADHAATPLDYGAGHVVPAPAFDPGLVYDSGELDWLRYMCGIGQNPVGSDGQDLCPSVGTIDPSNLNYPSIAIGDIGDIQTVIRRVTNVSTSVGRYRASVVAPPGYTVKVVPASMAIPPGQAATFAVTFIRTTAVPGQWCFGSLTWTDGAGHQVRSPIALRPATTNTSD